MITRRQLLKQASIGALLTSLPGLALARAETDARLVLVILRGAMDGMSMLAPYGDAKYRGLRADIALPKPGQDGGLLKVDGLFGLHPSLKNTYDLYQSKQALLVHAVASPYRERSHFDGQDVMENGAASVRLLRDGWLNRALAPLGGGIGQEQAIALSQNTPLVLRGEQSVTSWAPSQIPDPAQDTMRRIEKLYAHDEFFSSRLAQALDSQDIAGSMAGKSRRNRGNKGKQMEETMRSAAKFLVAKGGPRIAVVESGGWDTHQNQGASTGSLANSFSALDQGIATLKKELGDTWSKSVVMVVTEFGRTARVNGTRGTDHGTATAALLAGGALAGGRIIADWPGLSAKNLYEGRDLMPTTDIRSVFKSVLSQHLLLDEAFVDRTVFPDSNSARIIDNVIDA